MEREKLKERYAEKLASCADLPPVAPLIEIYEQKRVLVENHRGILAYGENEIEIRVKYGSICIYGEGLHISRLSKVKLLICGKITGINLREKG